MKNTLTTKRPNRTRFQKIALFEYTEDHTGKVVVIGRASSDECRTRLKIDDASNLDLLPFFGGRKPVYFGEIRLIRDLGRWFLVWEADKSEGRTECEVVEITREQAREFCYRVLMPDEFRGDFVPDSPHAMRRTKTARAGGVKSPLRK